MDNEKARLERSAAYYRQEIGNLKHSIAARRSELEREEALLDLAVARLFLAETQLDPEWELIEDPRTLEVGSTARLAHLSLRGESFALVEAKVLTDSSGTARFLRDHHTNFIAVGADGSVDSPADSTTFIWKKVTK